MKPRDYIRRKDNHLITAVVVLAPDQAGTMTVRGPFREMRERASDWERVPPVCALLTNIWRYNCAGGYWELIRDSYPENVERWLEILRGDEPDRAFRASHKRPETPPHWHERQVGIDGARVQ